MQEGTEKLQPRARTHNLVVRELGEEVLVYDLERHKAICLNQTAAFVWKHCDGRTDVARLAALLSRETGETVTEDVVWFALDQLGRDQLLEKQFARPVGVVKLSRRELMRRVGAAAALSLPLVTSIIAPTEAQAASCKPSGATCASPAECCSGLCPSGTCT